MGWMSVIAKTLHAIPIAIFKGPYLLCEEYGGLTKVFAVIGRKYHYAYFNYGQLFYELNLPPRVYEDRRQLHQK